MTSTVITAPPVARGRRLIRDGWTMTRRNLAHVLRAPEEIVLYFSLPIMFVLVFGYVFGSGMAVPGGGSYREFLLPGIFVLAMLQGIGATATSIATDVNRGVVDRFRSMPMARSALVIGRSVADLFRAILELAVLVGCGLMVGWGWHRGIGDALLAIGLLILLRMAITWIGIYLGLAVPNPDTVSMIVFPLVFPLTAVSNVFVAPDLLPDWLGTVAEANPLSATVATSRELFGNPGVGGVSWASEHATLLSIVWPLLLIAIFASLAVRKYQALNR